MIIYWWRTAVREAAPPFLRFEKMKHIVNPKRVPKGYAAITWFPCLAYYASQDAMTDRSMRHEEIHGRQQAEMLIVFFYIWYGIEYLFRRYLKRLPHMSAYHSISFEQEAYENDWNTEYLKKRKVFAWFKYI